jgi:hypothetical protein
LNSVCPDSAGDQRQALGGLHEGSLLNRFPLRRPATRHEGGIVRT